ncbi:MAG: tRNA (guanosine(46)-N7)-methyltransferase TrmB [Pseudomonadota bacterium]
MNRPKDTSTVPVRREIKSFVRREGRITSSQKDAVENLWPRYGMDAPGSTTPLDLPALFGRTAPVVFEIGFGAGDALLFRAERAPEQNFIGVEVHRPGVGRVLNRAEKLGLDNLRVASHDAVEVLRDWLAPGCLDELILEFPDPWHKTRHHKRRIVQPAFAALVASRLKPGGLFRLATDWVPYAEHMREVLDASADFEGGEIARPESRPITRFEARGERLGHAMCDLLYRRR